MSGAETAPGRARDAARVVVVGAGISGLACARRLLDLAAAAGRAVDLLVLEAGARAGGAIRSALVDGFVVEEGPDNFITDKPWAVDLCRRLGLTEEIVGTNAAARRAFVLADDRLRPIPEGFALLAPGRLAPFALSPILSPAGRVRVLADLVLPRAVPAGGDESLGSFVRRRLGSEALERLAQPLVAGIYDADPDDLSLAATFPRFLDLERRHRSVLLGLWRSRGGAQPRSGVSGARYSLFVTLRRGLGSLVEALVAALPPGALRLGAPARRVAKSAARAGWEVILADGARVAADAVVIAAPAWAAAPLVRGLDDDLARGLEEIAYGTSATVSLAWSRDEVPHPLDGFGFVVPRREGRSILGCTFSSVKYPGRAPAGTVLLRAFVGQAALGTVLPGLRDDAAAPPGDAAGARVADLVRADLRDILGITAPPRLVRAAIHRRALPRYAVGHLDRVRRIDARLARHAGLALAGNALRGIGIPDCVKSGETAAERVHAHLFHSGAEIVKSA